jgi:hypothetical protein
METSTWILIVAILLIAIGLGLSWYAAIKALNSAFSPREDHGLFWGGTVCLTIGILLLIVLIVMKNSKITTLTRENYNLYSKVSSLQEQLGKCGGGSSAGPGSSGPGFFSRLGSRIGGFFSRNSSVPATGNPGEVNPFKNQQ